MAVVIAFIGAHELSMLLIPAKSYAISSIFQGCAELAAAWRCASVMRQVRRESRPGWAYLTCACVLTALNTAACFWIYAVDRQSFEQANFSDFLYIFNYISLVLAVGWNESRDSGRHYLAIDVAQAGLGALLSYALLFGTTPFSAGPAKPIDADTLIRAFGFMNITLAGYALARYLSQARRDRAASYERLMATFVALFTLIMCVYNEISDAYGGPQDGLIDLPFLLLWAQLGCHVIERHGNDHRPLALIVGNLGPAVIAGTVICLSVVVSKSYPALGMCSVLISLLLFALRNAMSQSRYVLSQGQLEKVQQRLEYLSLQDGLTSLANRRQFDQQLNQSFQAALRSRQPLSLLMIDIDHFKLINDARGHLAGDQCLIQIAQTLRQQVRSESDLLARYGGEEFALILPDTSLADAQVIAEQLIQAVRQLAIPNPGTRWGLVTISIGIGTLAHHAMANEPELIGLADSALYRAKQNGRNQALPALP